MVLLERATLPDGAPAFGERELTHMQDVRTLFVAALRAQLIAAIVDRFLAGKRVEAPASSPLPKPEIEAEAGSMYTPPPPPVVSEPVSKPKPSVSTNGNKSAVDFVSEDDVRRAIQKGEKIYINAKTIITPAARDLAEPAEVFAKV